VYLATAQGYQVVKEAERVEDMSLWQRIKALTLPGATPSDETIRAAISTSESDIDQRQALRKLLQKSEPNVWDITAMYEDRIIYPRMSDVDGAMSYYQRGYTGDETSGYTLEDDPIEVKQVTTFEPVKAADPAELAAAEGCRCHSINEGDTDMTKQERIKALIDHANNPIKDTKALEALSDEVLSSLEAHAAKLTADQAAAAATAAAVEAKVVEVEAALKAAEAASRRELTADEFMKSAPAELRDMIARHKAADARVHGELVASLKTAQSVHTEDVLKAKTLEQLQEIAALLKLAPVDYSLRAARGTAEATTDEEYKRQAPPDGYAEALKRRRETVKH
jgi:hypothetical protein